jgi:hypothetical protein
MDLTPHAVTIVGPAAANAGPAKVTQLTVTGRSDTVVSYACNLRLTRRWAEPGAVQLGKDGIPSGRKACDARANRADI